MQRIVLIALCGTLAACNQGVDNTKRVWGGQLAATYEQDYNRKAETELIRSKEIESGSECIGQNFDGICHGTVIPNE